MGNKRKGVVFLLLLTMLPKAGMLKNQPFYASQIEKQLEDSADKINDLEQHISDTDNKISTYEQKQEQLQNKIRISQEQISTLSAKLDATNSDLEEKREEIAQTKESLELNQKKTKEQYEHMKLRIRYMYENSSNSVFYYIFEAGSLAEALRRVNYFQAVTDYDRDKVQEYKVLVKQIRKEKELLETDEQELIQLKNEQKDELSQINLEIESLKSSVNEIIAQMTETKQKQKQYKKELEEQKEYEAELERQKAEADRKRMEEIRRQEEELARQQAAKEQATKEQAAQNQSTQSNQNQTTQSNQYQTTQTSSYEASESELEALSTIIYCEAGGEPYEGQVAVGSVVMNRVASSSFPNTILGVIYQSGQFSPVGSGRYATALANGMGSHCTAAARAVLNGTRNVSCLYFCVNNGSINGTVIGHHVFY